MCLPMTLESLVIDEGLDIAVSRIQALKTALETVIDLDGEDITCRDAAAVMADWLSQMDAKNVWLDSLDRHFAALYRHNTYCECVDCEI